MLLPLFFFMKRYVMKTGKLFKVMIPGGTLLL